MVPPPLGGMRAVRAVELHARSRISMFHINFCSPKCAIARSGARCCAAARTHNTTPPCDLEEVSTSWAGRAPAKYSTESVKCSKEVLNVPSKMSNV